MGGVYPLGIWLSKLWLVSWFCLAGDVASLPMMAWKLICLWIVIVSSVLGSRTHGHSWDRGEDGCWAHVALDMPDKL